MSPTSRTLRYLRKAGAVPAVVERWNPGARVRQDLYRFIDVVALEPGKPGLLAVQTTSGSNMAARLTKIAREGNAALWLACGNRVVVHGWAKRGPRGRRKVWELREVQITATDLAAIRGGAVESWRS
jgi:hypothetical protein